MASTLDKSKTPARNKNRQDVTRVQYTCKVKSDFMRQHLEQNIGSFITVYGRIGALLRLVASDINLSSMVHDWAQYNMLIADSTFKDIEKELENIQLMGMDDDGIEMTITRPDPQPFTWNVNHASFTGLIKFIIRLDEFLTKAESTYYKGLMTDNQHQSLTRQVQHVMSTYLERILKATSPGKRVASDKAKYNNKQLLAHIRDGGYRLEFESLSPEHQEIVNEYNQRYAKMKSLSEERAKARAKNQPSETQSPDSQKDDEVAAEAPTSTETKPKKRPSKAKTSTASKKPDSESVSTEVAAGDS